MQTTNLLAVRTSDGRRSFASYKDEQEKALILAWAKANAAEVEPAPPPAPATVSNLIA